MIWLVLMASACGTGGGPAQEVLPPLEAKKEHVLVLSGHGSGSMGIGVADEIVRHNLPMLEACAVEADLPPGTCFGVRFQVKLPRHGGRVGWVSEAVPRIEPFTACLTRELQNFSFPTPETAVPGSALDVSIVVASEQLEACAERIGTNASPGSEAP